MLNQRNRRLIAMLAFFLCGFALSVMAGTNGKITGIVKDKETGDALPGVNVILDGTTMGAASNAKGEFSIINVPAGVYSVSTSMIGYSKTTKQNVRVLPDFTTRLDFDLTTEALSGEEVVIVVDRPLIQKDQTMTMAVTGSDEIKALPVRGFQSVANLGSGFVVFQTFQTLIGREGGSANVSVRGGRPSETGVYLDGFLQNNLVTGVSQVQVANSAVEEIVAITGGFNAEYGRNQSGIIQIVTKSGTNRYSGSAEYVTDRAASAFGAGKFGYDNMSAGFGGPVIPNSNKMRFYASGEIQRWDDGDPSVFGFPNYTADTSGSGISYDPATGYYTVGSVKRFRNQGRYSDWGRDTIILDVNNDPVDLFDGVTGMPTYKKVGARPDRANAFDYSTFQGKLTSNITSTFKLDLNGNYGETKRRIFVNSRVFSLDHVTYSNNVYYQLGGTATYTVNENSFFEFGGNYNFNRRRLMDDEFGWNINWYADSIGVTRSNILGLVQHPAHGNALFQEQNDQYWAVKSKYVSQIDKHNLVQIGADFYHHTIRLIDVNELTGDPAYGTNSYVGYRVVEVPGNRFKIVEINKDDFAALDNLGNPFPIDGAKNPISFAFFGQDKLEYEGLILNLGLRYDLFNPGTKRLREFTNLGDNRKIGPEDFTDGKTDHKLSPRVSVSFPVSEKTTFRLSYGKFFQQPNLQALYVGSNFLEEMINAGPFATDVQNPNLKAEESTQYEVGIQRALTDNFKVDVSAYYKDISNLVNTQRFEVDPGYKSIILYGNNDHGIVKGIVVSMEMRRMHKVSGRISYTLQTANGTGSEENSGFRAAWLGYEETKFNAPLNYDQRHRVNMTVDVRNGKKEGPAWGGHLLENAGLNFLVSAGSGFPYTPITPSSIGLGVPGGKVTGRRNSQYGPWTFRIDMKADRTIDISNNMSVTAYVQIMNLLDTKNANQVHPATGSAYNDGYMSSSLGQTEALSGGPDFVRYYDIRMHNGLFFDTPRQARIGVVFNF